MPKFPAQLLALRGGQGRVDGGEPEMVQKSYENNSYLRRLGVLWGVI
jgi:hypothetical protein